MTKGKHALAVTSRRLSVAEDEIARLNAELEAERAARKSDAVQHRKEIAASRRNAAGDTVDFVQRKMAEHLDEAVDKVAGSTWRAQRIAMTDHLARLFFSGVLDWDRFRGDRAVLSFIAVHGDIDTWWVATHKLGHRESRQGRRVAESRARRHQGIQQLLALDREIEQALGTSSAADQVMRERKKLDDVVEAARDAAADSMSDLFDLPDEVTDAQREILDALAGSVDEFRAAALVGAP